ncbi:cohesin domain-containing protein [Ruminiclostridium cellulolyticum]|uniref:Cellulosome anchoring protein cohesin region n=1 Tax=Ruminiclostridium cellulolyticum (strain ATCC 35319 / DSM 5812 / JCM 6584 / H10) TaxID=394503 RepID=B8I7V5_RUMCH|nr:cohesin domain-containing protein [Ruminiclostridium cellulolyticum]ACL75112.1 cellulosome anchoring protein cohesin region [Ruminiclostridium cellulolyticum H10]
MKKVLLAILIIVCATALVIFGVNHFTSDSETSTSTSTISSTASSPTSPSASASVSTSSQSKSSDSKSAKTSAAKDSKDTKSNPKDKTPGGEAEISIGKVSGATGSTVTIPVKLNNLPKKGIGSFNFNIKYDTDALEVVEVKSGEIFGSNNSNFDYTVIDTTGLVSFLYTSSNSGKDAVTKPGVITNITFKIKDNAKKGSIKISQGTSGAFGDTELKKINPVFTEGEITVK